MHAPTLWSEDNSVELNLSFPGFWDQIQQQALGKHFTEQSSWPSTLAF